MSKTLTFLFLVIAASGYTQIRQIKMSVYFDTDKYNLRKDARLTLDKLADSIRGLEVTKIIARGNTDNRADSLYNVTLSQNRTSAVSNYLVGKGYGQKLFTQEHFGEDKPVAANADEKGMQNNRRVDVLVYYRVRKAPEPIKEPVLTAPVVKKEIPKPALVKADNPCTEDTVLILSNGTQVQMSKCDYRNRGNCLTIEAALTPEEATAMNLTTRTDDGVPLSSGGMISIVPKPGCDGACFDPPVKVRFPIRTDCPLQGPGMFNIAPNGAWVATREKLTIVTIDGISFYEFEMRCPGKKNVDKPCPDVGKTKVKAPRGKRILETTVSQGCPLERYVYKGQKRKNGNYKRKIKVEDLPCDMGMGDIRSLVIDKKTGDTLEIKIKPVQNLRKRLFFPCKECNRRRFLWIFKVRQHFRPVLSRKYVYKKKRDQAEIILDLKPVQPTVTAD